MGVEKGKRGREGGGRGRRSGSPDPGAVVATCRVAIVSQARPTCETKFAICRYMQLLTRNTRQKAY